MSGRGCDAHRDVSAEVRALAEQLAEAIEPWAQRLRGAAEQATEQGPDRAGEKRAGRPAAEVPGSCSGCPVCAVLGLARGERPELAARLAEHTVGLLSAVRELLAGAAAGTRTRAGTDEDGAGRPGVQRVPLRRAGGGPGQAGTGGGGGC